MYSSFILDETGTAVLLQGTFSEMLEKCNRWVGQPTFYMMLAWPFSKLPIQKEIALRLPSLMGMILAAIFVYRIGRKVAGAEAGSYACLIFSALASSYVANTRPYALGLMTATGAMLFLIRWMEKGKWLDVVAYSVFAALTVYFHYLFSVIFLAHAVYILMHRRGINYLQVFAATLLTAGLLVPVVPGFLRVMQARNGLNFVKKPGLVALVLDSFPASFYAFGLLGVLVCVLALRNVQFDRAKFTPEAWLLVLWAIVPVVGLFVASRITPVFLPRYFSIALPGLALMTAWAISKIQPSFAGLIIVFAIITGAVLERGSSLTRVKHANEDWRGAMAAVRSVTEKEVLPVLVRSDFIESGNPDTFTNPGHGSFLYAPQVIYPAPGIMLPLPIRADDDALRRLDSMVDLLGDRFLLVSTSNDLHYEVWLRGRLGPGFTDTDLGNFGTVSVNLFSRSR